MLRQQPLNVTATIGYLCLDVTVCSALLGLLYLFLRFAEMATRLVAWVLDGRLRPVIDTAIFVIALPFCALERYLDSAFRPHNTSRAIP
jgi:hypothetical protein